MSSDQGSLSLSASFMSCHLCDMHLRKRLGGAVVPIYIYHSVCPLAVKHTRTCYRFVGCPTITDGNVPFQHVQILEFLWSSVN